VECCTKGEEPMRCRPEESAEAVRIACLMREARNLNGEKVSCK